jgi:uncharacterized membrane protein
VPDDIARRLLAQPLAALDVRTQNVARHVAGRRHITRDLSLAPEVPPAFGARAADAVARFGGSWTFVGLFGATLVGWVAVNAALLARTGTAFDPYPYILLNLLLSSLAAVQAPVILMAQNRQAQKDRLSAAHDYEVNLKAELEIMLLHEKLDDLRLHQWQALMDLQNQQLDRLRALERP